MKLLVSKSIFIITLILATNHLHAHVALDYPLGGENFIVGQTALVQWHIAVPHETLNWDLYFSTDEGVNWTPLQLNMPVTQLTYEWEIPNNLTTQGRIRVFMNNVDQDYLDISMNFTIAPNTTPPFLDAPAEDITIECSINNQQAAIDAWLANHGGASATNFCDDLVWSHDYTGISNGCGASGSTQVIFTAADACGFTTTSATLSVVDTQSPEFSEFASNMVVECNGSGNFGALNAWLSNHGGARASDQCGIVQWSHDYTSLSDDCGASGNATVNFTATDNCGNLVVTAATFMVQDNISPVITEQAQDTIIECGIANQEAVITNWLNRAGGAQATDVCGNVSWTNNYTSLYLECGSSGVAEVTFRALDDCANNVTTSAIIRIEDTTSPVILQQAKDIIIDCGNGDQDSVIQNWLDNHAEAIVSDQCGTLTWSHDFSNISDSCVAPFSQLVIFTVADECFNTTILDATITFVDTIIPKPVGFLDSTYVWTQLIGSLEGSSRTHKYTFDKIPRIESGKTYYELLRADEELSQDWDGTGMYMRYDSNIVYVPSSMGEEVLYNFNLKVNDTILEYLTDVPLIVDSIDTVVLLNGEKRKRWKLRCENFPGSEYYTEWIEGIGDTDGLFSFNDGCQIDGEETTILCLSRNDTLLYDNPTLESCWYLRTSTTEIIDKDISIYPNPASESFTIDFRKSTSHPVQVLLLDVFGKILGNYRIPYDILEISVNTLPPGIYLIHVETEEGILTRRIVVE